MVGERSVQGHNGRPLTRGRFKVGVPNCEPTWLYTQANIRVKSTHRLTENKEPPEFLKHLSFSSQWNSRYFLYSDFTFQK